MKYLLPFILIIVALLPRSIFAAEPCTDEANITYGCYQKNVNYYCMKQDPEGLAPWNISNGSMLSTAIIDSPNVVYPQMSSASVEEKKIALEQYVQKTGKPVYQPPTSNYSLDILSLSRGIYNSQMNSVFACAMLSSRIRIAEKVVQVNETFGNKNSEIITKIKGLNTKLENQRKLLQTCNGNTEVVDSNNNPIPMRLRLLDTASYQYCNYRYYLEYLQKNVNLDFSKVQKEMNDFRAISSTAPLSPKDTAQVAFQLDQMNRDIASEVTSAKRTYPVAITAFVEMERTYSVHLLLQFIQSDYLDLRENLRNVLNPISQLFYKVMNAQSANKD